MQPALVLVVLIASGQVDDPLGQAVMRATKETLGESAQIVVRHVTPLPADDEALALAGALHADGIAEIGWSDEHRDGAKLRVHVTSPSRWIDREIRFASSDASAEKGRTIGFAVASMLPEAPGPSPALAPSPAPAPALGAAPLGAVPAGAPSPSEPAPMVARGAEPTDVSASAERAAGAAAPGPETRAPIGAVDASAMLTGAGVGAAFGGAIGGYVYVSPHFALRAGATIRRLEIEETASAAVLFDSGLGVAWRSADPTRARPFAFGARVDALAMHQSVSHFSRLDHTSESQARWLPGADFVIEGSWAFADGASIVLAGGAEAAFGSTDVYVRGAPVATLAPLSALTQLGIRARF